MFPSRVLLKTTGFLGFGTLNNAVATGLLTAIDPIEKAIISNRSVAKSTALAKQFPDKVTIAKSNQELVDESDMIFIAVLPQQAKDTISALNFRSDHRVVSLMAGITNEELSAIMPAVQPENIVRAVPLPPVKDHAGVTVVYPPDAEVCNMFGQLGTSIGVETVEEMNKLPVMTCMMGTYYELLRTCHQWLVENGVDSKAASKYVGAQMHSIATDGKKAGEEGFEELIAEQTPGGYNEMGLRELREAGVWDELRATLSSINSRWEGKTTGSDGRPITERGAKLAAVAQSTEQASPSSTEGLLTAEGLKLLNSNPEVFDKIIGERRQQVNRDHFQRFLYHQYKLRNSKDSFAAFAN